MTPADYAAIERALTNTVLAEAYHQANTGWQGVGGWQAMRNYLMSVLRALPAEGERTCATCRHNHDGPPLYGHRTMCWHPLIVEVNKGAAPMVPVPFSCTLYAPTVEPERP